MTTDQNAVGLNHASWLPIDHGAIGRRGFVAAGIAAASAMLLAASPAQASRFEKELAPKVKPWDRWARHDPASDKVLDHQPWNDLLARHLMLRTDGRPHAIAYGKVDTTDRQALAAYLQALAGTEVSKLNRDEQRAYWINFYNALTVKVMLDHYPVASIRDINISPGLFASGPWDKKLTRVEGEELSLNDMEHRILRAFWRDPLLHYAVNCASVGCPNLQPVAFTAANALALMQQAARDYINSPRGVSLRGGALVVSKIYLWFQSDFGGSDAMVIRHLLQYAGPEQAALLRGRTTIDDFIYDWRPNDAA
jgi:Protein of unknown function, DUF547